MGLAEKLFKKFKAQELFSTTAFTIVGIIVALAILYVLLKIIGAL